MNLLLYGAGAVVVATLVISVFWGWCSGTFDAIEAHLPAPHKAPPED